jgi:hypothetical protein
VEPDPTPQDWPDEGPGNYRCDICGEFFAEADDRDAHERQDHGAPGGQAATQEQLAGDQARQDAPDV